jgi:outer membrane protein assembly complex protein YaeT
MYARRCLRVACTLMIVGAALGCREEGGVAVSSLKFTGTKAVSDRQLKAVLATAASDKVLGLQVPWGTKRYFSREQFEADLKRIVAFYRDRGFPDARVASFDASLSADQTSVKITIDISEGEPIRVERIEMEGLDPLPADHREELDARLPLKVGQPLDRALLQANREAALDELRDHGHPYASVRVIEEPGSSERLRVIRLRAEPGPLAHHGPIEITGNTSVGDAVIRRQLTFKPGDPYRQSRLLDSQRRLYSLETFAFANVEPVQLEQKPAEIPVRVTVTEGKHRKVNFGVGYGTEEKARGEVDWRHVNWFGGARTAGVFARYSARDRGVRLNFTQPYFFHPRWSLGLTGQSWYANEPAYELSTLGGRLTITRHFARGGAVVRGPRPSTTMAFTYANEWDDYTISAAALDESLRDPEFRKQIISLGLDPRTGIGGGQRSAVSVDIGRNTTENLLDARRGYVATAHFEQAGKWLKGSYNYTEVTLEGRYYHSIADRAVVAVRTRARAIDGFGTQDENVPFFKRYFLGGATNLRGWGRLEVAPLSGGGLPIGGATSLDFSTELRMALWGKLGGVLFLDGGNVWPEPWDFDLSDLRYDVGPGLRYDTPIGPIRLDLGYQLNQIPGLVTNAEGKNRRFRLHFSIGHAF